jgi:hypothetical protein
LYLFLSGGLGNQLHSLAASFSLAATHNLNIVVFATNPSSMNQRRDDADISTLQIESHDQVRIRFISASGLSRISWFAGKLLLRTATRIGFVTTVQSSEKIRENLSKSKLTRKRLVLNGHYENAEFPVLARNLGFKAPLELNTNSKEYFEIKNSLSSVVRPFVIGVHIRLGDFRTWHNGEFLLESEYYIKRISLITEEHPDAQIWLFSDEPLEAKKMLQEVGRNIYNISEKYKLNNAEEMKLLSLSDALICSRSTFSWWAAFWNQNQNSIFYPDGKSCLPGWIDLDLQVHT